VPCHRALNSRVQRGVMQAIRTVRSCFFLMNRHTLLQQFRYILSIASLAYTFTSLHTIQYSMRDHDDNDNTTTQAPHDSTTASSSTHDTPATTSTAENVEKSSSRWSEDEVKLLLDYIEANCVLRSARGLNLKKSEFNKARDTVKTKDANQCHYKWGHVCTLIIHESFHCLSRLSSFIAMRNIQGNIALGQQIGRWLA